MFPGDDALDQLHKIWTISGPLDKKLTKNMDNMFPGYGHKLLQAKYKGLSRKEICKKNLKNRYKKKIDRLALDLLAKLLDNNPETRPTAREALRHEWFHELLEKDPKLVEKIQIKSKIIQKKDDLCVERILKELAQKGEKNICMQTENLKNYNHNNTHGAQQSKKDRIFKFSDIGQSKNIARGRTQNPKGQSYSVEKGALRGYGGVNTKGKENLPRHHLESLSRLKIEQKIKKKNFSVNKNLENASRKLK